MIIRVIGGPCNGQTINLPLGFPVEHDRMVMVAEDLPTIAPFSQQEESYPIGVVSHPYKLCQFSGDDTHNRLFVAIPREWSGIRALAFAFETVEKTYGRDSQDCGGSQRITAALR
jgi:hypothetical protein